ncbi:PREDICTED: small integral membrane protein 12-like [Priapulus caudatus]|uniref:Small integral membrane protein 12-like n=1 Tax=Priapulus caudatus TaxID=37621 RepID=A0ABM1EBZ1_PRICU|nr:PREDICTED: small integral membrane protein 12-like [Priapulus caudatus]
MVWFILWNSLRAYAPYIVAPVAAVIGIVGYNVESWVRKGDLSTPYRDSIQEQREDRLLDELTSNDPTHINSLKEKREIPRTVFRKNDPTL